MAHQIFSLALNRNLIGIKILGVTNEWPKGSKMARIKPYRGLQFAEIHVDINSLFIPEIPKTDWLDDDRLHSTKKKIATNRHLYVHFSKSWRLAVLEELGIHGLKEVGNSKKQDTVHAQLMERILECSKLPMASISVVQKINGDILVVDGFHRLTALYLRDGNLQNLRFFITL